MKIAVPYFKSKKDTDCGPVALKMVSSYFNKEITIEEASKLEEQLKTGMVWSLGIAVAAKKLGFKVKLISSTNFNFNEEIKYYQEHANDEGKIILEKLKKETKKLGIEINEENISLNKLLKSLTKESIPIVLVNWFVISGKNGFSGHFLPLVGYDKENIYVHNPGIEMAQAFLPIKKELFLKAWESKGTDKDTIIISKN